MGVARRAHCDVRSCSSIHGSIDLDGPVDVHDELVRHGEGHRPEHQREGVGDDEHVPKQAERKKNRGKRSQQLRGMLREEGREWLLVVVVVFAYPKKKVACSAPLISDR